LLGILYYQTIIRADN